jgi:uncharacterized membrane protein YeaQ/YmgE (transglycosylase-associated protein family)
MKSKIRIRIGITLVGLLIGAITDWFYPHGGLPDFVLPWSIGAFFASFLLKLFVDEKPPIIALLVSLGVALAVLARLIYDTTFVDPTSHQFGPFEIIICGIITIPCAFAGVYLGLLYKNVRKRFDK